MVDKDKDVVDRLARIETKLDVFNKVEIKANDAARVADKAHMIARENKKQINEIKENNKWIWGFVITFGLALITGYLTHTL
ncbi:hemolysin XhlA family protein [Dellaglioa sp. BT-FLS60]